MFTPAAVLGTFFRTILSIAIIAGGIWLVYAGYNAIPAATQRTVRREPQVFERRVPDPGRGNEKRLAERRPATEPPVETVVQVKSWRPGFDRPTAMLAGGILLLLFSLGGRFVGMHMFLRSDPAGHPKWEGGQIHKLARPDGSELHVEIHGLSHGPTVVLTHGWSLNHREWAYLKRDWGSRFRMVVWDLPGLGSSTQPRDRSFTMEVLGADLNAVVEFASSGSNPVVLMGHSIGGMITQTFCRLFPQQLGRPVVGLVLIHTTYINPLRTMQLSALYTALQKPLVEPLLYLQIGLSPLVWLSTVSSYMNGSLHRSTARSSFGGNESKAQLDDMTSFQLQASPAVVARGCLAMLKLDETATLSRIPVPVLVVSAKDDPITSPEASEYICATVPHGTLHTLPATKHFGLIEYNQEFAETTAVFCEAAFAKALPETQISPVPKTTERTKPVTR